ncbi:cell envelope-like function transcriptional attenuator common domain protein [Mycobacterium parascrofulaceum ATCC BAA-614]|uniref:Cell envelope-like function transcriptional attenuator common domain protein n=1 Tax=Mycobacterium parascrofulaceum ATCC BAA-614 TaxID=525368 RepID=D5P7Z5_9MYCO|nr:MULTISPECIES: LCP family protein [Mycobacterium]EFG77751.1 cell envelope-like function transcriptional attenuator common domain protein [Mycobacterium parascrofulaceum ATCC BAA-614]OCB60591.1 transcriptional regulator [Mycobacterium malmoense]
MSDAEGDATPDARRPALGAAPWERFSEPPADYSLHLWQGDTAVEPARPRVADDEGSGCHTGGGVSVADLIAKLGAPSMGRSTHRRAEPDVHPAEAGSGVPVELQQTQVIEDLAYSLDIVSELPDLGAPPVEPAGADERRRGHGHRPMLLAARSVAALLAVLAVAMTGGAWQWSTSKNARLNTVNALDQGSDDIRDRNGQYGDEDFLIVGMDSRAGDNANMGAGDTEDAGGARSDTVMLVNIPANRKRVVAVSFPRDLAITPIQCEAWNPDTGKYGPLYDAKTKTWGPKMVYTETKLNSAFAFGGPKCLVKEIQKLSGLSINRFIAIDFSGFAKMVDALGGVEVCSKSALHDYELGTVLEHGGRQVLDGPTALNYVRARQVTTETNGDYGRIKRQQLFLSSLLRSLISEDTLLDLNKLNNVVNMFISDTVVDNVQSKDLIHLGQSLQGMAAGHVTFVTVPTGITDQNGDEPPRMADMRALFDAIINDDPLPEENDQNAKNLGTSDEKSGQTKAPATKKTPAPTAAPEARHEQVTTTTPGDVTVRVSNATTQSGLAATATSQLKRDGFNVMTPDDYPSAVNTTTVLFSPGNEQAAATVASSFANAKVQRVSGYGQVVQVVLGPDFKSVATPQPSGSSISLQIERGSGSAPAKLPEDLTVTNAADTTCE